MANLPSYRCAIHRYSCPYVCPADQPLLACGSCYVLPCNHFFSRPPLKAETQKNKDDEKTGSSSSKAPGTMQFETRKYMNTNRKLHTQSLYRVYYITANIHKNMPS